MGWRASQGTVVEVLEPATDYIQLRAIVATPGGALILKTKG